MRASAGNCTYSTDQRALMREICATAFYGLTATSNDASVDEGALFAYAVELWNDPPGGCRDDFEESLSDIDGDQYAPLTRTESGRLAVAEGSYAY